MFTRMAVPVNDQEGSYTRKNISRDELNLVGTTVTDQNAIIRHFAAPELRLITVDENNLQLTHDALLHNWQRLRGWLVEDQHQLRLLQRLSLDTRMWLDNGRHADYLYRRAQLARTRSIPRTQLNQLESEFVSSSRRAVRGRAALALFAVVLIALLAGLALVVYLDGRPDWPVVENFPAENVNALVIVEDEILIGTQLDGVLTTTDMQNWDAITDGIPPDPTQPEFLQSINALTIDPCDPQNIYVGTDFSGVLRLDVANKRFTTANFGIENLNVRRLTVAGDNLLAVANDTLFLSQDGGYSWLQIGGGGAMPLDKVYHVVLSSCDSATSNILAATKRGLFVSPLSAKPAWKKVPVIGEDVIYVVPDALGISYYVLSYHNERSEGAVFRWTPDG